MSYEERVHATEVQETKAQKAPTDNFSQRVIGDVMNKSASEFANTISKMQRTGGDSTGKPILPNLSLQDSSDKAGGSKGEVRADANGGKSRPREDGAKPAAGGATHTFDAAPPSDKPLLKKAV